MYALADVDFSNPWGVVVSEPQHDLLDEQTPDIKSRAPQIDLQSALAMAIFAAP